MSLRVSKLYPMKFLADVNIAQLVIRFLINHDHNVLDAKKDLLLESDIKIIGVARNENRIILTRDKDFIELVKLPKYQVPTIVFRVTDQKPENIRMYLEKLLENTAEEILSNSLVEVFDNDTRIISLTRP